MNLPQDIRDVFSKAKCLFTRDQIETALDEMSKQISEKLADKNPVFLCVVIGGIVPLGNLLPRLDFPLEVDYVHATRYRGATSGGELVWKAEPTNSLQGRTVIIVDDILDSGLTLAEVVSYCQKKGASEVYTAVLVDKTEARQPGGLPTADFKGVDVGDYYVFGYGMDYKEYLRNAPGIYAAAPEHM